MDFAKVAAEARAERTELLARVLKLDIMIATAASLSGEKVEVHSTVATMTAKGKVSQPRSSNVMSPTKDAVREILRRQGHPMRTGQLVPLVEGMGVAVGGKNSVATLSARLSNAVEFTNNRGIGWWFVNEALPSTISNFNEAEGRTLAGQPSASNLDQEESKDATTLT